jgi:hypothetical protein
VGWTLSRNLAYSSLVKIWRDLTVWPSLALVFENSFFLSSLDKDSSFVLIRVLVCMYSGGPTRMDTGTSLVNSCHMLLDVIE